MKGDQMEALVANPTPHKLQISNWTRFKLGVLGCKPLVLSREDGHLLLCDPGTGLGFVPLLLAKLHPVLPEARGSSLGSVVHGSSLKGCGRVSLPNGTERVMAHGRRAIPTRCLSTRLVTGYHSEPHGPSGGKRARPRRPHTPRHHR